MTETPTEAPAPPAPERRRSSLNLTTRDMLVSMVVIVAAVGVLLLLVPRPNSVPTRTIAVASAASGSAAQLGFKPSYPAGLGAGWNPTVADVQVDTDDLPTWHVDYTTPTGHYVGIQQTRKATAGWESRQVTDGKVQGSVEIAGRSWLIRSRTDRGITSYVLRRPPITTVVTGTATAEEMAEFTAAVMPPA